MEIDKKNDSIAHLESSYAILKSIEYKERHDKIGHYMHWKICKYFGILDRENLYLPELMTEAKESIILWHFAIQTDRSIKIKN